MKKLSQVYLKDFTHQKQIRADKFKQPINVLTKGRATLPVEINLLADKAKVYSITIFIATRKKNYWQSASSKNSLEMLMPITWNKLRKGTVIHA